MFSFAYILILLLAWIRRHQDMVATKAPVASWSWDFNQCLLPFPDSFVHTHQNVLICGVNHRCKHIIHTYPGFKRKTRQQPGRLRLASTAFQAHRLEKSELCRERISLLQLCMILKDLEDLRSDSFPLACSCCTRIQLFAREDSYLPSLIPSAGQAAWDGRLCVCGKASALLPGS